MVRLAPLARTKSRPLSFLRRRMKCHVLAACKSCRARRTAVDAGSLHGIDKGIVRIFLPMDHCLPTLLVGEIGLFDFVFQYGSHEFPSELAFMPMNRRSS